MGWLDGYIQAKIGKQILPPLEKDLGVNAAGLAYGIAILYFPHLRSLIYKYQVETVTLEAGFWFRKNDDVDAALVRIAALRAEIADEMEKTTIALGLLSF